MGIGILAFRQTDPVLLKAGRELDKIATRFYLASFHHIFNVVLTDISVCFYFLLDFFTDNSHF
ncbi:MAG: hypothetical protein KKH68_07785 [Proteobacteria bacterium]|nr:hypothetical protein [Pseudomonadota bacterium]